VLPCCWIARGPPRRTSQGWVHAPPGCRSLTYDYMITDNIGILRIHRYNQGRVVGKVLEWECERKERKNEVRGEKRTRRNVDSLTSLELS